MAGKAATYSIAWDFALAQTVDNAQRWVLTAMQRYGQELITMLWRILGNEQDVCDAYQDTFLRLAHYEDKCKPEYVKSYLFRTAANVAISMLRRKMAQRRLSATIAAGIQDTYLTTRNKNDLDSRNLQENLRACITQLPEHLRNVVTLRDLAELSYSQVGKILKISAATARVYRCKAIQLLAVWMSREKAEKQ